MNVRFTLAIPAYAGATLALIVLIAACGGASAQSYPVKTVRLIVPYPPGGGNDALARLFGQKLSAAWGQQVIVDNRPGAGTTIGTTLAARAPADGYTLLLSSIASHGVSPSRYRNPGYDPIKDFAPITLLAVAPMILGVNQAAPITSVQDLIKQAKARPGTLKYATAGSGSPMHMGGEIFKDVAGVDLLHVPYSGGGPALISLIAGETDIAFDTAASILPQVRAGRLRALAIARASRLAEYPNIQTFAEAGLPAYEANAWYSMHAPAGTPPAIIRRINAELVKTMAAPDVIEKLRQLGSDPGGDTPEALGKYVRAELDKYSRLIKKSGIKVE
ncbi:MAG: Tricarboxylate transport protein TctC [Betaproteobacteria bacterium]|nr:Tricarboxylate transport protein TctC [Betaproteobacteria bacterium]